MIIIIITITNSRETLVRIFNLPSLNRAPVNENYTRIMFMILSTENSVAIAVNNARQKN